MNDIFIFTAIGIGIIAIIIWAFFAVILDTWVERCVALIVTIVFWLFITLSMTVSITIEQKNWNNGNCIECGGKYKFSGIESRIRDKNYYYTCEDCDHTIKTEGIKK